ncbi:hypothetical protein mRhiFer1_005276 [Rhinolophus ferrumequinum]|uniref:Formin GTPase-binding domain-containing protein n=1 Tax=Rhinolophus ferrumequinum TaxID=59479 RepID=A0A7J7YHD4_RHIFE|nr:hypothetical protein mRhiFer1_005276 [Rhinolophus ferrumequinum]
MGNAGSMDSQQTDFRAHNVPLKLPMPEPGELEERFAIVLNAMNLPPDKARLLRQYDNEKKWELICDQERFQVKNPPHTYIQKLKGYLDPAVTRKVRWIDFHSLLSLPLSQQNPLHWGSGGRNGGPGEPSFVCIIASARASRKTTFGDGQHEKTKKKAILLV